MPAAKDEGTAKGKAKKPSQRGMPKDSDESQRLEQEARAKIALLPQAADDERKCLLRLMGGFRSWLIPLGLKENTVKTYVAQMARLAERDGRSFAAMATVEYFKLIKESPDNLRGNGQFSASVAKFILFYNHRMEEAGGTLVDASWEDDAHIRLHKADPASGMKPLSFGPVAASTAGASTAKAAPAARTAEAAGKPHATAKGKRTTGVTEAAGTGADLRSLLGTKPKAAKLAHGTSAGSESDALIDTPPKRTTAKGGDSSAQKTLGFVPQRKGLFSTLSEKLKARSVSSAMQGELRLASVAGSGDAAAALAPAATSALQQGVGEGDQHHLERLRKAKAEAVKARRFQEASVAYELLKSKCEKLGVPLKSQGQAGDSKTPCGALPDSAQGGEAEEVLDRVSFARGILRENFPLAYPSPADAEDDAEVIPTGPVRAPKCDRQRAAAAVAEAEEEAAEDAADDGRQVTKARLADVEDASYGDIDRFPAVAATFHKHLLAVGFEEDFVGQLTKALHDLFAQDEKALDAMVQPLYAELISNDVSHARAIALFAEFWRGHSSGPFEEPPPRVERGFETKLRREHGVPKAWGIRVVQRACKEDLVILTSPAGERHFSLLSKLPEMSIVQDPEGDFAAERVRRLEMSTGDRDAEAERDRRDAARAESGAKCLADSEACRAELEQKLLGLMEGEGASSGCGSCPRLEGLLCRQHLTCGKCGHVSGHGHEMLPDNAGLASGQVPEASASAGAGWDSYEDMPEATEEEVAMYPQILATFHLAGYPYLLGLRKLVELHKKKPLDMATEAFQRLVRKDPENSICNNFMGSSVLYFIKFRTDGHFDRLVDMSKVPRQDIERKFTPDFTKTYNYEQCGWSDLQIDIPLELLMADATEDWAQELREKLDGDGMIQEDVDASGYQSKALSIALLPSATPEEWARWPRVLARFEAVMRDESDEPTREAEAAELLRTLKEVVEEHGKGQATTASRRYMKMVRTAPADGGLRRVKALGKFFDFWERHQEGPFPEPRVHALSRMKYELPDRARVEAANKLWSQWQLPEGWAVKLRSDLSLLKVVGPGKNEVYHTREQALAAAAEQTRRSAEEVKAQLREQEEQRAKIHGPAGQAASRGFQSQHQRLKGAMHAEDYLLCAKIQVQIEAQKGSSRAGQMPVIAREVQAGGRGAKGTKRREREAPEAQPAPKIRKKNLRLGDQQRLQAAAQELTLKAHEWRVVGVRLGDEVRPLGDPALAGLPAGRVTCVLTYIFDDVRERKKQRIIQTWGLDDSYTVTVRMRLFKDQITVRRSDGRVFLTQYDFSCDKERETKRLMRKHTPKLLEHLRGVKAAAVRQPAWELSVPGRPDLSGFFLGSEAGPLVKVPDASLPSGVEIRAGAGATGPWDFVDAASHTVLARASLAGGRDCDPLKLELVMHLASGTAGTGATAAAAAAADDAGQGLAVSVSVIPPQEVLARLAARLAAPCGCSCLLCARVTGTAGNRASVHTRDDYKTKATAAGYEMKLEKLGSQRETAPRNLTAMVAQMLEKLRGVASAPGGGLPAVLLGKRTLRIGTMCSGTDAPVIVAKALERTLRQHGSQLSFEHAFSVEFDVKKQGFIRANFPECQRLFADVTNMGRRRNFDVISEQPQPIPGDLDLLVAGFSCKDLSLMNSYRKTLAEMGQSGSTLRGVLDYVERYRPRMVLLENVWAITKGNSLGFRQIDLVMDGLRARGYAAGYKLLNSCDYFVPQVRHRIWMWGLRLDGVAPTPSTEAQVTAKAEEVSTRVADRFNRILRQLEEPSALHFDDCLLEDDHPAVRAQIERVKAVGRRNQFTKKKGAKLDWQTKYGSHRADRDYQFEKPYTNVRDAEFLQQLNERERELVDLKCLDVLNEQGRDPRVHPMLWELTQSVERVPGTRVRRDRQNYAMCILPGNLWHSSRQRWVLGVEKLALQGIFAEDLKDLDFDQKLLGDLAGNAFTTTVCAANVIAAILCWEELHQK